uniref:Non-LTR retroelement reverse transcriptase n=1 Tax=Solanum tuberosum TaxID=4113 RepID=M1DVG4_SOLTU
KVTWSPPEEGKLKCNINGACRGNPGMGSCGFCLRNHTGDLVFAKAKGIWMTTNMEAEALAIYEALSYFHGNGFRQVIIETDSLCLKRMILKQWRVPWEMVERIEKIRNRLQ